ncbi:hypothetical protein AAHA92_11214 [Salvia divinorum]|uniref:Uncharacterized protein n=1 Tax=Salvia divinorum TaxID=28513 RepID=A0ABD1HIT2_SALDI
MKIKQKYTNSKSAPFFPKPPFSAVILARPPVKLSTSVAGSFGILYNLFAYLSLRLSSRIRVWLGHLRFNFFKLD